MDRTKVVLRKLQQLQEKIESLERRVEIQVERQVERLEGEETNEVVFKRRRVDLILKHHPSDPKDSTSRFLQLQFTNQPSIEIYTMRNVKGEHSDALSLVLVDPLTRQVVSSGPESSMEVELVLLNGDFISCPGIRKVQYFEDNIVRPRKAKFPLLVGDKVLKLSEGIGKVDILKITDNSSSGRSGSFRLAARAAYGFFNGIRVEEAITRAFVVKDMAFVVKERRLNESETPLVPRLSDEVWSLAGIPKGGLSHRRLTERGIYTVDDFLRSLNKSSDRLRDMLRMPFDKWELILIHAKMVIVSNRSSGEVPFLFGNDISKKVYLAEYKMRGLEENFEWKIIKAAAYEDLYANGRSILTETPHTLKSHASATFHGWRKYWHQYILGAKYPREYFVCNYPRRQQNLPCEAEKRVERISDNPATYRVTYSDRHSCGFEGQMWSGEEWEETHEHAEICNTSEGL